MEDATSRSCSVEGCGRRSRSRGWCNTHYERWRRTGNTDPSRSITAWLPKTPLAEWFWSLVDIRGPEGCWPFTGTIDHYGYGVVRGVHAQRIAWELTNGPIPAGMVICHRCDNPPCCNPADLFLGTKQDNSRDMAAKGRWRNQYDTRLVEADVREIRRLRREGTPVADVADRFGLSRGCVKDITRRRTWKHVP